MFFFLAYFTLYAAAAAAAKSLQLCPTLCDPIESSPSGSTIPGILQARNWTELPFLLAIFFFMILNQCEPIILKDNVVKMLHSIRQQIWKTQWWPQDWKKSVFIPILKKGNTKECSNYHAIALISHASKIMLEILHARLQQP